MRDPMAMKRRSGGVYYSSPKRYLPVYTDIFPEKHADKPGQRRQGAFCPLECASAQARFEAPVDHLECELCCAALSIT